MQRSRLLIADDHSPFLRFSTALLEEKYDLVGTIRDGLQLMANARDLKPDVVLCGLTIPYLGGIEACRRLRQIFPDTGVVLLGTGNDHSILDAAMRAGASGFVLKRCLPAELCRAIEEALDGRIYVTPLLAAGHERPGAQRRSEQADRPRGARPVANRRRLAEAGAKQATLSPPTATPPPAPPDSRRNTGTADSAPTPASPDTCPRSCRSGNRRSSRTAR